MNDKRFDAWWASNPARESLNPVAKEVARGVWRAAQRDLAAELLAVAPQPTFKEMADALWISQLGVVQPNPAQRELWQSPLAFAEHTRERLTGDLPRGDEPDKGNPC